MNHTHMHKFRTISLFGSALLFSVGCSDSDPHSHHEESPEEEACEHLADGPFEAVTAAALPGDGADISFEHTRVDVALLADGDEFYGWVSFAADEDAEFTFFLTDDVPFAIQDLNAALVAVEESEIGSEFCDDIAVSHTFDLAVGTYALSFGPSASDSIGLVVEEAGEHAEHADE